MSCKKLKFSLCSQWPPLRQKNESFRTLVLSCINDLSTVCSSGDNFASETLNGITQLPYIRKQCAILKETLTSNYSMTSKDVTAIYKYFIISVV